MTESPDLPQPGSRLPSSSPAGHPTPDPRRWTALAVLLTVQFMLILDISIVNVALPTIRDDLGFEDEQLAWVVDAYVLMAGGLLLLGGRLGDVFGRRRVFAVGTVVFGLASAACAAAPTPELLVAARFAQGAGEALAAPAAFGLIALMFTDSTERAKAIGFFGGVSGVAGTSGPILGGVLVETASWRWIFLINVPIVVVALLLLPRLVSGRFDQREPGVSRRVDVVGAVLVTGGSLAIVYGAVEAASAGWGSAEVLVPMVGGALLLVAFVVSQRLVPEPLMPLRFFSEPTRVAGNVVTVFFYSVFLTQFFLTTLYLQEVRGFSALEAGLGFLPFGVAVGVAIGAATALQPRVGTKPILLAGLALSCAGLLLFSRITADGTFAGQVLPASVVMALGSGLVLPSLSNAAVHRVSGSDAGLASGLQQALQQIGGAIGLAVLLTLAIRSATDDIAAGVVPPVAVTDGYVLAFRVAAAVVAVGLVLALVLMRSERAPAPEPLPAGSA